MADLLTFDAARAATDELNKALGRAYAARRDHKIASKQRGVAHGLARVQLATTRGTAVYDVLEDEAIERDMKINAALPPKDTTPPPESVPKESPEPIPEVAAPWTMRTVVPLAPRRCLLVPKARKPSRELAGLAYWAGERTLVGGASNPIIADNGEWLEPRALASLVTQRLLQAHA